MKTIVKYLFLLLTGGFTYVMIELLYRGYSHWTMFFVGGICFILIGLINEVLSYETPLWIQSLISGLIVTIVEFFSGCIINLWFKLDVWNYSDLPFNILGQVCLPFTIIWCLIGLIGVLLDDWLRWKLFHEEKPYYKLK